jgi:protein KRI1
LKSKDEGIYDKNVTFFEEGDEEEGGAETGKDGKMKKMRYKDVVREHILEEIEADEKGAALADDGPQKQVDGRDLAYDVEQREIRRAFLESTRDDQEDNSEESEDENWLKPKTKTRAESDKDHAEVKRLWEQEFASSNAAAESELIDPKGEVQDPDKFLMDFMTNRKWIDSTDAALRKIRDADDEESIESFQDKMDDFESKYNFRFEEAAAAGNEESGAAHSIVHYARGSVGENALRRKDETRRQKRLSRKERKAEERKAKEEQLRRLKNAKREELEERMQQVRNVLGYDAANDGEGAGADKHALGAAEEEMILKLMEGEYDPEKFEQVMNAAYGEDYYQQEDEKWKSDQDVKSDLAKGVEDSDVVGSGDMYDDANEDIEYGDEDEAYPGDGADEMHDEEEDQWESEQYEETGMEKKLKSKMMDELYKLDYEDIIGDMPTRFKYRSVEPNSYGLSTTEILMANDTSLKQFVSLKKMAPYRDEVSETTMQTFIPCQDIH